MVVVDNNAGVGGVIARVERLFDRHPAAVLLALGGALLTVHQLGAAGRGTHQFLVLCLAGLGAYMLWTRESGTVQEHARMRAALGRIEDRSAKVFSGDAASAASFDADLFTLRTVAPAQGRPLRHLPARPGVVRALVAAVTPLVHANRGGVWRVVAALEDFYARCDVCMVDRSGAQARRSMRTLLDTRAEALNALHALTMADALPGAQQRALNAARRIVRRNTQRCLATLAHRHRNTLRGTDWAPPYASDPRREPHYHVHY